MENAYKYAWSNKENAYEYVRYCKTNEAQQYSKGKQVTFDLPSDLKELWCVCVSGLRFRSGVL